MTGQLHAPLIGFRVWRVSVGRLVSLNGAMDWAARPVEARCPDHEAPAPCCGCGIYAVDSLAAARDLARFHGLTRGWRSDLWSRLATLSLCGILIALGVAGWRINDGLGRAAHYFHAYAAVVGVIQAARIGAEVLILLAAAGLLAALHDAGLPEPIWRSSSGRYVVGAVQLWGASGRPVIVSERADGRGLQFRAPYARVVALAASRQAWEVGARLGLPVVRPQGLEVYAREFGEQLRRAA
jgi:hypothetical protein